MDILEEIVSEIEGSPPTTEDVTEESPDIATRLRRLSRRISHEKSMSASSLSFESSGRLSRSMSLVQGDKVR